MLRRPPTPYLRLTTSPTSSAVSMQAPPGGAQPWGTPEGKNGRPTGGLPFPVGVTNAESHSFLARGLKNALGGFPRCITLAGGF
jgi:hypothetical protein